MSAGCTAVPVRQRDDVQKTLPEQFAGRQAMPADSGMDWKQSFSSDALEADVATLLEENLELEAARARVQQAAANYGIQKSLIMPSLDVKADFDRSRTREDDTATSTSTRNNIAFEAALNWEPDIWGRLRARKKAASFMLEEKQAVADQIALNLQSLLVETWVAYHGASMLEQVLTAQQETNRNILGLTELRFAQGDGHALDVLQQRGRLAGIDRILPGTASEKRRAENAYAVLMGRFPGDSRCPGGKWPDLKRLAAISSPRSLLRERPDLKAAFVSLKAADQEVAAAIADRLPRISIGLIYTESGQSFSDIGQGTGLSFAAGLLAPVFDAERLKAKASLKKAQALESLAILKQAMLIAVQEVEDTLIEEQALFEEQALLQKEMAIALEKVDQAKLQYGNGQESFLNVLVALTKLQTLQQEEIILKQKLLVNRCRLLKALGKKWSHHREET